MCCEGRRMGGKRICPYVRGTASRVKPWIWSLAYSEFLQYHQVVPEYPNHMPPVFLILGFTSYVSTLVLFFLYKMLLLAIYE